MRTGLVIAAVAALFMTVTGPLGTGAFPLSTRGLYWALVMGTGAFIGTGVSGAVRAWGRLRTRPSLEGGTIAVLIALPLTVVVAAAGPILLGSDSPPPGELAIIFAVVTFVSAVMTAINYVADRAATRAELAVQVAPKQVAAPTEADEVAGPELFVARLPGHLQGSPILAIQAEDHYLRVHCRHGQAMLLMRLSDAIGEMGSVDGAQTHRSWWVARDAVRDVRKGEGRAMLRLESGIEAPVSRTFLRSLAAAGWFGSPRP